MTDAAKRPNGTKRESKLPSLRLAESGFLFDPYTGLTYGLNTTGRAILGLLKQGIRRQDIAKRLAEEFDVPESTVAADTEEFLETVEKQGLLWTR